MALVGVRNESLIRREVPAIKAIAPIAHVDAHTLKTVQGDYVQMFRLEGLAHETAHDDEIAAWHEQLGLFIRNIASPHHAIWTHVIRQATSEYVDGTFPRGFARDFNERYRAHVTNKTLLVNELYLSIIYRPHPDRVGRALRQLDAKTPSARRLMNSEAIERINNLSQEAERWLSRYSPERLGTYEHCGHVYSELEEVCGFLINGYWQRMPLMKASLQATLCSSRPLFGREALELRTPENSIYAAALAYKEYPDPSFPGMLNELLRTPVEFVLTQSFAMLDKAASISALKRQYNRLESTEDDAVSEVAALQDAIEGIASNRFTLGEHHLVLLVKANDPRELSSRVAEARRALSGGGGVVAREDLAMEAAFWSQLPGAFNKRPRPSPVTSRNFVGMSAMHNYPSGKRENNHWGPALALLKTASGAPYFLSLHRADVGHFALYGSTGVGKTVVVMFLITMMRKFDACTFYFDKDRGGEICIRALGGRYFVLRPGTSTGLAPFQLKPTPENVAHVQQLVRAMVRTQNPFTARESNEIDEAVAGVFSLSSGERRMAHMLSFLNPPTQNNIAARLLRWVASDRGEGPLAWVFDNARDGLDLESSMLTGFDMTHFLDVPEIRTPMMLHLFHRIDGVKDGRRGATIIDEGWKALDDEVFAAGIGDSLKTDRKKNWLLGLITQSPKDTLGSKVAHTISEQTATKIFMPNINARHEDYVNGLGTTEGVFDAIKGLAENGRRMVIKQGQNAVVAELDLGNFEDDVAIFSGTAANVALLDRIRAKVGDDPEVWLPIFHRERKSA